MTQNDTNPDDTHLIRGATLPSGERADILVADGLIREIGPDLETPAGAHVIEADGLVALPGLVDLHVHLREPGYEQSETVLTGSRAAALGGFTAVFAMANTMPVQDTAGVGEQVKALGDAAGYATVRPIGAVSVGLAGESMAEIGAMASSRAAVRVFSDDWKCVSDPLLMRRALEYVKAFDWGIAQHAQDPRLTEGATMNEGALSGELGITGWPAVAEESIIARDVLLAEHVGSRLHVCHVSTAGSVDVIRWAKARGVDVTAEVTPHHLLLTEDLVAGYDARYKVNPPLRRREDVEALRQALADGTIDVVATDHAPHPTEAKDCEWDAAAFGMVGLESALSVVQLAMVDTACSTGRASRASCRTRPRASAGSPSTGTRWPADPGRHHALRPVRIARLRPRRPRRAQRQLALPRDDAARPRRRDLPPRLPDRARRRARRPRDRRPRRRPPRPRGRRRTRRGDLGRRPGGTRMSGRLVPAITVIALLVLLLALMVLGWRARRRRQRALPEPPRLPAGLGAPTFEVDVLYVATTTAGQPLDRLTVAPLGFRGRAAARVHDAGLVLAIDGEREVLVPADRITGSGLATYAIDRVVEEGGLVAVTWILDEAAGTSVDTYLRVIDPREKTALVDALHHITRPAHDDDNEGK